MHCSCRSSSLSSQPRASSTSLPSTDSGSCSQDIHQNSQENCSHYISAENILLVLPPALQVCKSALTFSAICSACSSDTFLIQQWGGRIRDVSMTGKQRSFLFRFLRRILSSQMPSMFNIPMFNQKNEAKTLRLPISSCTLQFEQTSPVTLNLINLPSSPLTWVPKRSTHHGWQA